MTYRNPETGKFCTSEEYFEHLFNACDNVQLNKSFPKNSNKYSLGVKVVAYYDVDVFANSFEEASAKVNKIDSFKLLTENIPFDCESPKLTSIILQD